MAASTAPAKKLRSDWFRIPISAAPFFGGVIGLLGVEFTRATAKKFFTRKEGTA
ncbi:hypothetical protein M2396_000487 [Pseudomonas sp. BIGb0278]|jgi:hypothetical protein|uniref:phage holin family protein n=1 Tax=Pseudomonas TaxID=286 RepID=UPI002158E168|nr:phage holin family protein [Pseudomonas plecoglossicida]MCS4282222.1 hypothetical protein [Pseudomonas sp. BIGb0278]